MALSFLPGTHLPQLHGVAHEGVTDICVEAAVARCGCSFLRSVGPEQKKDSSPTAHHREARQRALPALQEHKPRVTIPLLAVVPRRKPPQQVAVRDGNSMGRVVLFHESLEVVVFEEAPLSARSHRGSGWVDLPPLVQDTTSRLEPRPDPVRDSYRTVPDEPHTGPDQVAHLRHGDAASVARRPALRQLLVFFCSAALLAPKSVQGFLPPPGWPPCSIPSLPVLPRSSLDALPLSRGAVVTLALRGVRPLPTRCLILLLRSFLRLGRMMGVRVHGRCCCRALAGALPLGAQGRGRGRGGSRAGEGG